MLEEKVVVPGFAGHCVERGMSQFLLLGGGEDDAQRRGGEGRQELRWSCLPWPSTGNSRQERVHGV